MTTSKSKTPKKPKKPTKDDISQTLVESADKIPSRLRFNKDGKLIKGK